MSDIVDQIIGACRILCYNSGSDPIATKKLYNLLGQYHNNKDEKITIDGIPHSIEEIRQKLSDKLNKLKMM